MRSSKRTIAGVVCVIFGLTMVVSGAVILWERASLAWSGLSFQELRREIDSAQEESETAGESLGEEGENQEDPNSASASTFMYESLKLRNSDFAGWVKIEGTNIDYPVMHTPSDEEYYLRRNFEKRYSVAGTPFAHADCDLSEGGGNIIVYGHNLKDDSMFSSLMFYEDREYWKEHPIIRFDTTTSRGIYQIAYVLRASGVKGAADAFDYDVALQLDNENAFNNFLALCDSLSLYQTGETIQASDRLLLLSTCEYSQKNGRMILVAKLLEL